MIKNLKFILSLVVIVMALTSVSSIFAADIKNFAPKYGVTTANLNFRNKPNTNSNSIVKVLSKGTSVKMVGETSTFYIVQIGTNEVGYVAKSYIKATSSAPSGAKVYTMLAKYNATINGSNTNIRRGPSTSFPVVTKLNKGDTVQVIGKIDNFLLITTGSDYVGMIRNDLLTKVRNYND